MQEKLHRLEEKTRGEEEEPENTFNSNQTMEINFIIIVVLFLENLPN